MDENTKGNYKFLSLQVVPLTLKVFDVLPHEGKPPVIDRQVQWYLDKIGHLGEKTLIPGNFHLVTRDMPKGVYRYDVKLTYETLESETGPKYPGAVLYGPFMIVQKMTFKTEVFWYFYSPERLSKYQIGHLIREHSETYPPFCHPVFLSYELVGAHRGER